MRSTVLLPAVTTLALLSAGCSAFDEGAGTNDGIDVVAAFYPLEYVVERVGGDHISLLEIAQPGTEPHDLELNIAEAGYVTDADLIVYESGFQPAVDDAVEQNASGHTLDAAEVVDLVAAAESPDEHEDHADEEHDHGDVDPHFWQDPLRVAELGDAVAVELADIDPDHADDYEANAAALRTDLEELDEHFTSGLSDCERDTIVVSHDAFGYLEKYGVHVAPLVGLSPDAEPTAAVLGELQEQIEEEGITTVFSEPLEPDLVAGLAADLDLTTATLDPIEALTDETADDDYLSLMEDNLTAIREANGCR